MSNKKIVLFVVKNEEECKSAQNIAFKCGYSWSIKNGGNVLFMTSNMKILVFKEYDGTKTKSIKYYDQDFQKLIRLYVIREGYSNNDFNVITDLKKLNHILKYNINFIDYNEKRTLIYD